MRRQFRVGAVLVVVLVGTVGTSSCSSSTQTGQTTTTAAAAPALGASVGRPKAVADGTATADVILNGIRYAPNPNGDTSTELAVLDFTFTGTSTSPFAINEDHIDFVYSDQGSPYTHNDDGNIYGVDPTEDYTPFIPPQPLRVGQVTSGQTRQGLVILGVGTHTPYLVQLNNNTNANVIAEWALTSK